MIKPWIRYEDIEEKRDGYFVVYSPVFTGGEFAILKLSVYEPALSDQIKAIAKKELEYWALKYKTPIMLMISNMTDEEWQTKDKVGHNFLLGYAKSGQVICYWDEYPESEKPEFDLSIDYLAKVYSGLRFRAGPGKSDRWIKDDSSAFWVNNVGQERRNHESQTTQKPLA